MEKWAPPASRSYDNFLVIFVMAAASSSRSDDFSCIRFCTDVARFLLNWSTPPSSIGEEIRSKEERFCRETLADRRVLISTILCQLEFITDTIVRVAGMTAGIDVFTGYRFEVEF